jgi:hypothetical protein
MSVSLYSGYKAIGYVSDSRVPFLLNRLGDELFLYTTIGYFNIINSIIIISL